MWHLYPVRVTDGRLCDGLRADARGRYRGAGELHAGLLAPGVRGHWGTDAVKCPNAEAFYEEELSLPLFPDLTDSQVDQVIEALLKALR